MVIGKIKHIVKRVLKKAKDNISSKHVSLEVAELFFQHNGMTDFQRYDMIVRLLAVENYYGKNNNGFDLYYRMQEARMGKQWADKAVGIFKNLIRSYQENGYDEKSEIELDCNLHLIDGSHRMAMAMYHRCDKISAKVRPYSTNIFYGIEWFKINGFTDDECAMLTTRYKELKEHYSTPFVCTLWAPVHDYFDDITEKLTMFGEVTEVRDYDFSDYDYAFYTRGIYHVDDIEKWKIEKKIEYMCKSAPDCRKIRMATLLLQEPNFRLKDKTSTTLSKQCELIKKLIRDCYKDKIEFYFHDIVMHIGDNFYQNRAIYKLLTMPPIDVKTILQHIHNRKYVLTKTETPYMPEDFPIHYPLGKDIDIICSDMDEYHQVLASILKDIEIYKDYNIRILKKTDKAGREYRTLVRIEQEDQFLVLQFDIASRYRTGNLTPDFVDEMIETRIREKNYYVPSIKYEIIVRLQELHSYPRKKHHRDYVEKHKESIDVKLCNQYLKFNWRKLVF